MIKIHRPTLRGFPFYPLLLAVYPVLSLWAANFEQIPAVDVYRALLISFLAGLILYGLAGLTLRDLSRAALLSGLTLLLFFSYGHLYPWLEGKAVLGFVIGRHRFLALVWLALLAGGAMLVLKYGKHAVNLSRIFNLTALALTVLVAGQLIYLKFAPLPTQVNSAAAADQNAVQLPPGLRSEDLPDVYFIILDGYTRADALSEMYGYDNRAFIQQLNELGFVLPRCAQSNYGFTALSVTSIFNMDYFDPASYHLDPDSSEVYYKLLREYLSNSAVRRNFTRLGYRMIAFDTGYDWANISDADLYIGEDAAAAGGINAFENLLIDTTALRPLNEALNEGEQPASFLAPLKQKLAEDLRSPQKRKYDLTMHALDEMENIPALPGKKFVYLHIIAPHRPFIIGPDGEFSPSEDADPGYPNQVTYLNKRVIPLLKHILDNTKTPPVIILQGDHGWGLEPQNRMKILNAYYLPAGGAQKIYPEITPVNTFRIIFDTYFGTQYGLLEDKRYFSLADAPYRFTLLPANCPE